MKLPVKILEAARQFSNPTICEEIMYKIRWPDGQPLCPECESVRIVMLSTRKVLRCKDCYREFTLKQGTLFSKSPLDLGQWFLCLYALLLQPKITCQQLSCLLGVTLKTAWRMRKKLSSALALIERPGDFYHTLTLLVSGPE